MSKHNLLIKKIQKQILSINNLIESNFNNLKYFKSNYKKILLDKDNRVILGVVIVVILTLFYFLIPTIYNKNIIQTQIENQILKNYNIKIKFNKKIDYGLLPKPHFSAKNLSIFQSEKEIGITKNLKIFIGLSNFLSINEIEIKDLAFNKTDFNIDIDDLNFFQNLLKTEPHQNDIYFNNSNIFFKNDDDQVLFINKIKKGRFFYDANNLQNVLSSRNEIFNVPFKITVKNDKFNKKVFVKFNSKKIRLNIENETSYEKKIRSGSLDILFINKSTSLNYKINDKSLDFKSKDNRNSYKGLIDFKPFYFSADFNYEGLSSKNLFNDNSIFIDLINSEIFNNKNLSGSFHLNVNDITNINELKKLKLKISIEDGEIRFSDSSIMWKDDLMISFNESVLNVNDDGINFLGTIILNFLDINNFYSSFQIPKKNRKKIEKIQLDFIYNFNDKGMRFDNPRINGSQNSDLEELLNNFNSKSSRIFNKVKFKNFVNSFFSTYAG